MRNSHLPWFRLYTDILDDEILSLLAFCDRWHFVALMAMKGRGITDKKFPSEEFRDRCFAKKLGLDLETFKDMRGRLIEAGLIDDRCSPIAWSKRQFASDQDRTAVDRKRRQRERENTPENKDVGYVTRESRVSHNDVTRTDTDTDTDTDITDTSHSKTNATPPRKPKADHLMVIGLYHEILPELRGVSVSRWSTSKNAPHLQARWNESPEFQTPEFWRTFFETVRLDNWWMGIPDPKTGECWKKCNLAWLIKRVNFDKVLELGGYDS